MRTTIGLIVAGLFLGGCESMTSPRFSAKGFEVEAASGHVTLRNESDAVIHYVLVEEETSGLIDLYFDPEAWPAVAAGSVHRVPYEDITGYSDRATEARVHWWTRGEYQQHFTVGLP